MEEELPSVIKHEDGLIEVDLWQPHECKDLWDSLVNF